MHITLPILTLAAFLPPMLAANGEQTDAIVRVILAIIAAIFAYLQGKKPPTRTDGGRKADKAATSNGKAADDDGDTGG